jgi:hypothetical protein
MVCVQTILMWGKNKVLVKKKNGILENNITGSLQLNKRYL